MIARQTFYFFGKFTIKFFYGDDQLLPCKREKKKILFKILIFKIMPPNVFGQLAEISNKGLEAPGELRNTAKMPCFPF
jgi:hypothetical protein